MLALDERIARRCGPPAAKRPSGDSAPLSALAGNALDGRFRSWRGRSGRRYVFSVYDRRSCPAYEHAVMLVAATTPGGDRRVISVDETGCFPEMVLAQATSQAPNGPLEFHIHLLARSRAERSAVIADLAHLCRS